MDLSEVQTYPQAGRKDLRAEQTRTMAEPGHQASHYRIGFNAEPERRYADVRKDAVEALNQQKRDERGVAEYRPW